MPGAALRTAVCVPFLVAVCETLREVFSVAGCVGLRTFLAMEQVNVSRDRGARSRNACGTYADLDHARCAMREGVVWLATTQPRDLGSAIRPIIGQIAKARGPKRGG